MAQGDHGWESVKNAGEGKLGVFGESGRLKGRCLEQRVTTSH